MQCSSVGCSLDQWKDRRPWRPEFGPEDKFWGVNKKQRSCDGRSNEPKKTGARSARARTRGQNPLVFEITATQQHTIAAKSFSRKLKIQIFLDSSLRDIFFSCCSEFCCSCCVVRRRKKLDTHHQIQSNSLSSSNKERCRSSHFIWFILLFNRSCSKPQMSSG
jgi:hypothetical protein